MSYDINSRIINSNAGLLNKERFVLQLSHFAENRQKFFTKKWLSSRKLKIKNEILVQLKECILILKSGGKIAYKNNEPINNLLRNLPNYMRTIKTKQNFLDILLIWFLKKYQLTNI